MTTRGLLWFVVLGVAATASFVLLQRLQRPAPVRETGPSAPGYYLRDAKITESDANGQPLYRLNVRYLAQKLEDNSVELEDLRFSYFDEQRVPWIVEADRGRIPATQDRIELFDNVRITNTDAGVGTIVTTERLDVYPDQHLLLTDDRINIRRGELYLSAIGARIDLNTQKVELQSDVNGRITP